MKQKFTDAYMDVAERFAKLSTAERLQVGAIVVKDDRIISIGYNGMPSGWTNDCEFKDFMPKIIQCLPMDTRRYEYQNEDGDFYNLKTKPEVIHAEANAIAKLARGSESGDGSTMFLTHAPCIDCAKQMYTAGVKTVYYRDSYKNTDGLTFLEKCSIMVHKVEH